MTHSRSDVTDTAHLAETKPCAFCMDCQGDDVSAIAACSTVTCPVHPHRYHRVRHSGLCDTCVVAPAKQIRPSTKKTRGLAAKTVALREAILAAFEDTDKPVTVRQMFYMLTVRGAVPKTETEGYRPVQRQLVEMRRAGLIPYRWLADNTRWMRKPTTYADLNDFLAFAADQYRQSVWARADTYVEIWIEKDALAGVVLPVTAQYDVPLMVARGYSSESFAWEAAANIREIGKPAFVYYLGDFDPSGWDMSRGLETKLREFGADIHFERLR